MKKGLLLSVALLLPLTAAFGATYNVDAEKTLDLSGVTKIVFELDRPNMAMSVSTERLDFAFTGDGREGSLALSLEGDISTNNKKALPSLISAKRGETLTVRLFGENSFFFGLFESGTAHFSAVLPSGFSGSVEITTSSGDSTFSGISAREIRIASGSGNVEAERLAAENAFIKVSSGNTAVSSVDARGKIEIGSSSGNLTVDGLRAAYVSVSASSGRIKAGGIFASETLKIHSSSGRVEADTVSAKSFSLTSHSGNVTIGKILCEASELQSSSGSVDISDVSGSLVCSVSSGSLSVSAQKLGGDLDLGCSSGAVTVRLPEGSGFSADLRASSGTVRSAFKLLGDVAGKDKDGVKGDANGGGRRVKIRTSSGDISLVGF